MSTIVVLVAIAFLIAAAGGAGDDRDSPDAEQLRRDTEDIAAYGAVVRPRLDDERRNGGGGPCC